MRRTAKMAHRDRPDGIIPFARLLQRGRRGLGVSLFAFLLFLFPIACGETEFEFSKHRAYFNYDNSQHLDATLMSAMNSMSPGIFCRIYISNGGRFAFLNNQGKTSVQNMTEIERKSTCVLGVYNESGIIVGFGNLSSPHEFYAYDAQCPNCYEEASAPRYLLSMSSDGKAKCAHCGRTYDMNNRGVVASGAGGGKLMRYHASTTGPMGRLQVNN